MCDRNGHDNTDMVVAQLAPTSPNFAPSRIRTSMSATASAGMRPSRTCRHAEILLKHSVIGLHRLALSVGYGDVIDANFDNH